MPDLGAKISDGRVLVMDGAMGTMLYDSGVFVNVCYDELNASQPELIEEVHRQYIHAGAQVIGTNTFGANPVKLAAYGLDDRTEELNQRAARIARHAAQNHGRGRGGVEIVGVIGPLGIRLEPLGPTSLAEAGGYYARQVEGLLSGGVGGFALETFSDLVELEQAYRAVRALTDLPVIAHVTVGEDGSTSFGVTAQQAAGRAAAWGADAVGLNCSVGPAVVLDAITQVAKVTTQPLSALPNAGLPRAVGDRKIYLAGPQYMARYARRLVREGVRMVGGCCGTTPEHIRCIAEQVADMQARAVAVPARLPESIPRPASTAAVPLKHRSRLGRLFARGEFVVSVEANPPRGCRTDELLRDCRLIHEAGAHVVTLLEDRRSARMSCMAAAAAILGASRVPEPVVHYTCRDRKLPEMVGDLLGMSSLGLSNLILLTGDPPGPGPYPQYQSHIDIDAIGLTNVAAGLNIGLDPRGREVGPPAGLVVGVRVNHTAERRERELRQVSWKAKAGADFAVTSPVFDIDQLESFLDGVDPGLRIIAGIQVLADARHAEFLDNEVPGVRIPGPVKKRLHQAGLGGKGSALREGVAIAAEVINRLRARGTGRRIAGVHIVGARGDIGSARSLLEKVGPLAGPP